MAVPGKKLTGFKDSLSVVSTEDSHIFCDPCNVLGQTVEAQNFCVNCQENLCKRCLDYHTCKSTKGSPQHHLLDQPKEVEGGTSAPSDDSNRFTEYCSIHKKEIITYFCSRHDTVGCTDCMTLDHRTCNIDYIPDVCSGISKSKEFSGTLQNVLKALKEVKLIEQNARLKKTENKTSVAGIIEDIEKFQKKMNEKINQLKQDLVKEAHLHKSKQDQKVGKILNSRARDYSELKQVYTALTDCQTKQLDAQAFVTMKRAQWILSCTNVQAYEKDLTNVLTTILFQSNDELENILSQQNGLGRIVWPHSDIEKDNPKLDKGKSTGMGKSTGIDKSTGIGNSIGIVKSNGSGKSTDARVTVTEERKIVLPCIKQKKIINVKTESDKTDCCISGCAVIPAGRLLLADCNNNKLKIVNTDIHSVVEEITVDAYPWDVTVLPRDQVAVTLPEKDKILIIGTAGKLKRIKTINVERRCWGIACLQDSIYVVCQQPNSLLVLDMQGNVQRDISLQTAQDQTFSKPLYLAPGKDGQTLYISDWKSRFVASVTLQGNVTGVYKHNELNEPRGLVVMEDGSLLVCSPLPGTIRHISAQLKQEHILISDVPNAQSICCHSGSRQIYTGAWDEDFRIFNYEEEF